jgi:hypothetical protein
VVTLPICVLERAVSELRRANLLPCHYVADGQVPLTAAHEQPDVVKTRAPCSVDPATLHCAVHRRQSHALFRKNAS